MKKSSTAERLRFILENRNLKQVDILNICKPFCLKYNVKLNKNDLSQYVSGKVQPGQDKLSILGMALNVNEVWLMGYDVPMERELQTINYNMDLSEFEKQLVVNYRKADDLDKAIVRRTLGLENNEKGENRKNA